MDAKLRKRLDVAIKESGFFPAPLERVEDAITIRTPFIMPDGDLLDFHAVPEEDGAWIITDFGDVAGMSLLIRGHIGAIPDSYESEIQKVLGKYGAWHDVKFERATLRLETTDERLADPLTHFAQMVLHVTHICSFRAATELETG